MSLKKLTGQEVLAIIEENFSEDIAAFGYNDLIGLVPEDFELSAETQKKLQKNVDAYEAYANCSDRNNDEGRELRDVWYATKNPEQAMISEYFVSLGLGRVEEIDQHGGGEGDGSYFHSIKHFVDHDVYIKTTGYYSSYNGVDFHEGIGEVVRPKEKVITVFE